MYIASIILPLLALAIAVYSAYRFANFLEDNTNIQSVFVAGVLTIPFGIFVYWLVGVVIFPAIVAAFG